MPHAAVEGEDATSPARSPQRCKIWQAADTLSGSPTTKYVAARLSRRLRDVTVLQCWCRSKFALILVAERTRLLQCAATARLFRRLASRRCARRPFDEERCPAAVSEHNSGDETFPCPAGEIRSAASAVRSTGSLGELDASRPSSAGVPTSVDSADSDGTNDSDVRLSVRLTNLFNFCDTNRAGAVEQSLLVRAVGLPSTVALPSALTLDEFTLFLSTTSLTPQVVGQITDSVFARVPEMTRTTLQDVAQKRPTLQCFTVAMVADLLRNVEDLEKFPVLALTVDAWREVVDPDHNGNVAKAHRLDATRLASLAARTITATWLDLPAGVVARSMAWRGRAPLPCPADTSETVRLASTLRGWIDELVDQFVVLNPIPSRPGAAFEP